MFDIKVVGITEAGYFKDQYNAMIGLVDPNSLTHTHPNYHVEYFHDIFEEELSEQFSLPEHHHIKRVLDFSKSFDENTKLLVHCHAGISRSTAVAIAVLVQHGMKPMDAIKHIQQVRPHLSPNPRIIALADHILEKDGELLEAFAEWKKTEDVWQMPFAGQNSDNTAQDDIDFMKNILAKLDI